MSEIQSPNSRKEVNPDFQYAKSKGMEHLINNDSQNLSKEEVLASALRPLFTEGNYRNYEAEMDRKEAEAKGKGRNFIQNVARWAGSSVGKQFEATYMGIAHAVGTDNMGSLLKLTEEIFSNTKKYETDEEIKQALHDKMYNLIVPNEKLGLLTGEAAKLALVLSEFGPFNKNTGQVLEALKNQDKPKYASKIDYVLDKLCEKIKQARFNEAAINGATESIESQLLQDVVEIQNKLGASGTTGAREKFNAGRGLAMLGLGSATSTVQLVRMAAGQNLGENKRLEFIKKDVIESSEFLNFKAQIQQEIKAENLSQESADLLLEKALNRIAYNTYLLVAKKEIEANKITTAKLTMGGVKGFVNNAIDQGFATSAVQSLAGIGVNEVELNEIIRNNSQANAEFNPSELGKGALELYNSIEKVAIISTENTEEFVNKLRKQQITITDDAVTVTGRLVTEFAKQARDGSVGMMASTPMVAGLGAATYSATGGAFGFSVDKQDALSGFSGDRNIIQSRFDKGLGLNGGDMSGGDQVWNASMNLLGRANGTGNVASALLMPLTAMDNITGRHVQGGISSGIENVKTAGNRVAEFSGRVASSTWIDVQKSVVHTFTTGEAGQTTENTLPQPAQTAKSGDVLAQAANVATSGAFDFGNTKPGDKVIYSATSAGSTAEIPTTFLGKTGTTGTYRLDVNEAMQRGYKIYDVTSNGKSYPVIKDSEGNIISTIRTGYLLNEVTKQPILDANGRFIPVIIEGDGKTGEVKGAQIDSKYASMTPADFAAAKNNGGVQIKDNSTSVKPEATPNPAKPSTSADSTSAKPNLNNGTTTSSLLGGNARIEGSNISPDKINSAQNGSSFNALNELRDRTGNAFQTVFNAPNTEPTATNVAKPTEQNNTEQQTSKPSSTGKLSVDLSGVQSAGLGIDKNNMALAAELNYGVEGFSKGNLLDADKVFRMQDERSYTVLQRLAANIVANNNYQLSEEDAAVVLPGGATAGEYAEALRKNPARALDIANRTTTNAFGFVDMKSKREGSFYFLPMGMTITAHAENKETSNITVTANNTISSGLLQGGVGLPNFGAEKGAEPSLQIDAKGNVRMELPVFNSAQSKIDQVEITLPGGKAIVIKSPEIIDALNSGKTVSYDTLLASAYTVNPEAAKSAGIISLNTASTESLNIKSKDGTSSNYWKNVLTLAPYAPQANLNTGEKLIYNQNVGDKIANSGVFPLVLSTLDNPNVPAEAKAQIIADIQKFAKNEDRLNVDKVYTFSDEDRAKYSAYLLIKERNPELLTKQTITRQDVAKLASGLNINSVDSVVRANAARITGQELVGYTQNATPTREQLQQAVEKQEQAQLNSRVGRKSWIDNVRQKYGVSQNVSTALQDFNTFTGNKDSVVKDYDYRGTLSIKGPGYIEEAHLQYNNNGVVERSISDAIININIKNPQYEEIISSMETYLGPIKLGNFNAGDTVNKLAVGVLTAAKPPIIGLFARTQWEEIKSSSFDQEVVPKLSKNEVENKGLILAFVDTFSKDKEFGKRYASGIGAERLTPDQALLKAAGGVTTTEGKTTIILPNGEKKEFPTRAEAVKVLQDARNLYITVTGIRAENASISPNNIVLQDGLAVSTSDVIKGGSTFDNSQIPEIAKIVKAEAKEVEDTIASTRTALHELKTETQSTERFNTTSTPAELAKLFPGMRVAFIGTGDYKNGEANVIKSITDNETPILYNAEEMNNAAKVFQATGNVIIKTLDKMCTNGNALSITKEEPLGIETSNKVESKGGSNLSTTTLNKEDKQTLDASVSVRPIDTSIKREEPEEPKKDDQLTAEDKVEKDSVSSSAPGKSANPQQGTNGNINNQAPSSTPGGVKSPEVVQPANQTTAANNINNAPPSVTQGGNVQVDASATNNTVQITQPSNISGGVATSEATAQTTQVISQPASQAAETVTQTVNNVQQVVPFTPPPAPVIPDVPVELINETVTNAADVLRPL